jgi:hypothetical protein
MCLHASILSWSIFPSLYHTPRLERHPFITTRFIRYCRERYNRVRLCIVSNILLIRDLIFYVGVVWRFLSCGRCEILSFAWELPAIRKHHLPPCLSWKCECSKSIHVSWYSKHLIITNQIVIVNAGIRDSVQRTKVTWTWCRYPGSDLPEFQKIWNPYNFNPNIVCFSETSVSIQRIEGCHNPEEQNLKKSLSILTAIQN